MVKKIRYECIDAGSDYCPCYLAETNDCITCSHLQGKNFCDCDWRGVCVFQEYTWNNNMAKTSRTSIEAQITDSKKIGESLITLSVLVGKTLARQLRQPGSYVFIRQKDKPLYFDVPMSVMYADEFRGEIHLAIQFVGSKTKSFGDIGDNILLRGPYWNGILGLNELKKIKNSNALIVARGIALAPAVSVSKYLIEKDNKVTLIMDKGKISEYFINDYISSFNMITIESDIISDKGKLLLEELIRNNNYSLCYSGGSNTQHEELNKLLTELSPETKFAISNNKEICCGEGVCGSCTVQIDDESFKICKSQLDSSYMLNKGEY